MIWQRYPVFRVFLVFCSGILLANFVYTSFLVFLALLGLGAITTLVFGFSKYIFSNYRRRWIFGTGLNLFFLSLGVIITHLYSEKHSSNHLTELPPNESTFLIQLLDDPQEKERSMGVRAEVLAIEDSGQYLERHAKIMLYLQKNRAAKNLTYGDRIMLKGRLNELSPPMNPYEFDYKNYLNLKAIYFQAYADSSSWNLISSNHGHLAIKWAKDFRKTMLAQIDLWNLNEDQKAVTKALLLGYRYDIKDELLQAYSSAGAMHVLAVSGLHVGIVYLMATYLLFFLNKIKYGPVTKMIILILLLWSYAMITGLSASVVRAATMFTFVAIGSGFRRYTSIYNTILGSAILLMLFKPTFLFEVGFQLSYAAVFGIVWLQPRFQKLWKPNNWFLRQFWGITTVSIAAQIATFPLGLYYFHQFPTLFLISNWLVIPLVTFLMYIGLIALVISAIGWVPGFLVSIYGWLLWAMNAGVSYIEKQATFLLDQIHITRFELVLLYVFIVMLFTWFFKGKFYRLAGAIIVLIIFGGSQVWEAYHLKTKKQMVVYGVKNHTVLGFYENGKGILVSDSAFGRDDDALTFHVKHHWWANDIEEVYFNPLTECHKEGGFRKQDNMLGFAGQVYYMVGRREVPDVEVQHWIVHEKCYPPNEARTLPLQIILCGKQNYYQRKRWKEWAAENNVECWDTQEQGAYVRRFK
jgi:competence protein ComEC